MPLSGSTNTFSGQYLRLEEYVGTNEDPHLPASITSKTGLKGIAISSTGYFLVNSKGAVIETFGKKLTEAIKGADHTVTIEKGDWTLVAEKGEISIKATNTGAPSTMSFTSTGSDIFFEALKGKSSTSDRWDVKESTTNSVTFVAGYEYSGVAGLSVKENVGFLMNINVAGDLSIKAFDVKVEAFPLKYTTFNYGFLIASLKFQLISWKFGVTDTKYAIVYNKITHFQITNNNIAAATEKKFKTDTSAMTMDQKLAEAELLAADCSMMQLLKM